MNTKKVLVAIILVAVIAALPLGAYATASREPAKVLELSYDLVEDQRDVQAGETITYDFSVDTEATNHVSAAINIIKDYSLTAAEITDVTFTMDGKSYEVKTGSADSFSISDYAHIGELKAGQHTGKITVTYGAAGTYFMRSTISNTS